MTFLETRKTARTRHLLYFRTFGAVAGARSMANVGGWGGAIEVAYYFLQVRRASIPATPQYTPQLFTGASAAL